MAGSEPNRLQSRAWSCGSLQMGLGRANSYYGHLKNDELTEQEMQEELTDPRKYWSILLFCSPVRTSFMRNLLMINDVAYFLPLIPQGAAELLGPVFASFHNRYHPCVP